MASAVQWLDRARRFVGTDLWAQELRPRSVSAAALAALQFAVMVSEGFVRDKLLLRASALTYMAVLSVIPLLAVVLSILKALGISEDVAALAVDQFAAGSPGAKDTIRELVENANLAGLGTLGAATLLVTTVLALRHGELTLNDIWGEIPGRSWARRFADYLAILIVVPLSIAVALSLATTMQSGPILGHLLGYPAFEFLYSIGLRQAPTVMLTVVFTFVYWFLPNTRVRLPSALLGGVLAALLFRVAQTLYVDFSIGAARYDALFGGFAQLPLLLVWIYFSMAIVLMGAEVSFAHQNLARYRREVRGRTPEPVEREALALCLALEVARAFHRRAPHPHADELADRFEAPVRIVRELLRRLEAAGIVSACGEEDREHAVQLGRPSQDISVAHILQAVRGRPQLPLGRAEAEASLRAVAALVGELDQAWSAVTSQRSLAGMLEEADAAGQPGALDRPASGGYS